MCLRAKHLPMFYFWVISRKENICYNISQYFIYWVKYRNLIGQLVPCDNPVKWILDSECAYWIVKLHLGWWCNHQPIRMQLTTEFVVAKQQIWQPPRKLQAQCNLLYQGFMAIQRKPYWKYLMRKTVLTLYKIQKLLWGFLSTSWLKDIGNGQVQGMQDGDNTYWNIIS